MGTALNRWLIYIKVGVGFCVLLVMMGYAGYLIYASSPYHHRATLDAHDTRVIAQAVAVKTDEQLEQKPSAPARLLMPSVDLGVDVESVAIDAPTNSWPLSDTHVQYADFTPGLGSKKGTLLLYGHNSWPVLRKSNDIRLGDQMILVDSDGRQWKFVLVDMKNVTPDQVGFIYEDTPFRVVVFTCNGWNDQYRRLMFFAPIE